MNFAPLALYGVALAAYIWHFARRDPMVGRTATTLLVAAALAHTFVIGMQTMEVGHVPIAGATSAISTFVWLLALSYLAPFWFWLGLGFGPSILLPLLTLPYALSTVRGALTLERFEDLVPMTPKSARLLLAYAVFLAIGIANG